MTGTSSHDHSSIEWMVVYRLKALAIWEVWPLDMSMGTFDHMDQVPCQV